MTEAFVAQPSGILLELAEWQVTLLTDVVELVRESGDDPSLPVSPYPDDRIEDEQFRRLMASERDEARSADQSAVEVSLELASEGVVLSIAEAEAWLRVLGDARLVLAGRLGVTEGGWEDDDGGDEQEGMAVLHFLSWLQGGLTDVLLDELG